MTSGQTIGKEVANLALDKSSQNCFEYVRRGIQRAKNQPQTATGIKSAKDAGPWLEKQGFEEINTKDYQNGDIMIIQETSDHKHGHIQVYYNGKWYSDFKQQTPNPWINCHVKAVYRIKE